jgi:hypothetical protein
MSLPYARKLGSHATGKIEAIMRDGRYAKKEFTSDDKMKISHIFRDIFSRVDNNRQQRTNMRTAKNEAWSRLSCVVRFHTVHGISVSYLIQGGLEESTTMDMEGAEVRK